MKLALVSYRMDPDIGGGAPWSAWLVAKSLSDRGIDTFAVTTHDGPDDVVDAYGLRTYRLSPRNLYWVGKKDGKNLVFRAAWQLLDTWNPLMFRAVRRILEKERPDVVHVHKLRGFSPAVWEAAHASGIEAVVQTCRDYELMSPEGTLSGRVGRLARDNSALMRPYQRFRALLSRRVRAAVAPSSFTLHTLIERGFFSRAVSRVIPNSHGYSNDEIARRRSRMSSYAIDSQTLRVLYLGRLEEEKGVTDICAAVENLSSKGVDIVLDVAGDGSYSAALRRRFGSSAAVTFHGHVSGARKESLLQGARLLVVPTRIPEVFGNVIVEAYASGKPVIGTRVGGIPEIIAEERTGWLIDAGDVAALSHRLEEIASNPARADAMRDACFEASTIYTTEGLMDAHLALYDEIRR